MKNVLVKMGNMLHSLFFGATGRSTASSLSKGKKQTKLYKELHV
jgi:hypothetical protein